VHRVRCCVHLFKEEGTTGLKGDENAYFSTLSIALLLAVHAIQSASVLLVYMCYAEANGFAD
jgi:hypothetical protein